jgi:hypothetical protein
MRIILMLILLAFISCTTNTREQEGFERRNLEEYFQSSGVVKYFLPDLPDWANSNVTGKCMRKTPVRYFNYKHLMESFALDYEKSVQFQYMFNIESRKLKLEVSAEYLPLKDEEKTFYMVSDRIQAGIYAFMPPKFKRINLIWIDPALSSDKEMASLRKLMNGPQMDLGHPVFISLCLSGKELGEFVRENKFRDGIRFIPHTMFSPYNDKKEISPILHLNVTALFKSEQQLYLYLPKIKDRPNEIAGDLKLVTY